MNSAYKIAVVGLWHLGETFSTGLAELGHSVIGISEDSELIKNFSNGVPPLAEPGLEELIKKNIAAGRLSYSGDFSVIKNCNVLWITFDTPVDDNDEVDLSVVYDALEKAIPHLQENVLVVATSQLPVGNSKKICELITAKRPGLKFDYVYTPENLRLGEALKCFQQPGRIVVGADSATAFSKIEEIFSGLKAEILKMSPASAEMAKHALNAFLATSLSFINDIADVCEKVGADVLDVSRALKTDPRIGPNAYMGASLGFSGGTLGRDLKALMAIAKTDKLSLPVIENVYVKNRGRSGLVSIRLAEALGGLKGKKLAIFGVTYKAGTSTLRRSQALEVAEQLKNSGATVNLHDPVAERVDIIKDPIAAAEGCDAVILMTPWENFKGLDFTALRRVMAASAVFLDTRNFFYNRVEEIKSVGLNYLGIGR